MSQPVLTILAGSNGAGKSTLTTYAREEFQLAPVLDPDAVAKSNIDVAAKDASSIEAGKQVLRRAEELLLARQSFTVETTLSGSTYLRMAVKARAFGYFISVLFVGTNSVEINMDRVRSRVRKGGHAIPESDQRRRFPRTLANIEKLLPLADELVIFDNSTDEGYVLVAEGEKDAVVWYEPLPVWAEPLRRSLS